MIDRDDKTKKATVGKTAATNHINPKNGRRNKMSSMTRAEAMRKIESAIENHIPDSDSAELFNFQPYGISNDSVNEMLKKVLDNNPELDPNGEFEAIQSILTFFPSQERVRKAAYKYLAQYDSEEDFIDECGRLDKINDYFSGAHLTEDEIRAAFRKG